MGLTTTSTPALENTLHMCSVTHMCRESMTTHAQGKTRHQHTVHDKISMYVCILNSVDFYTTVHFMRVSSLIPIMWHN